MYRCPVCLLPLYDQPDSQGMVMTCDKRHSFDRHKKGYINLLLAQNKKSKHPGDDADMVHSRRAFLNEGYYSRVVEQMISFVKDLNLKSILDVGCGEGYYLNQLATAFPTLETVGFDISKPAIQLASQYKFCEWAVASSARMPYLNSYFDLALSVFSRIDNNEFSRVLKPEGYVLVIAPGDKHLLSLRQVIYTDVRDYQVSKQTEYLNDDFVLIRSKALQVPLALNSRDQIMNLLSMTPHSQRMNNTAKERLHQLSYLNDTADFRIYLYQKNKH